MAKLVHHGFEIETANGHRRICARFRIIRQIVPEVAVIGTRGAILGAYTVGKTSRVIF
ncbi:hypothetical protein MUO32_27725 [Shinella sp. CPCC 101442]|uniref:hypothetical protein n=1 Tax=Shinella sp. CPCC 101442 TaxID=2932265 RepID=UPI0021525A50|nr:hypothetical protein [Shinella sp. CPCC 101442]MCR6502822.1 hypothetical protein [Shinella sp. CPCC 101442]